MSSAAVKPSTPSKVGQTGLSSVPPSSQSVLLEKVNARTSTPDSEAFASSDDEADGRVSESTQAAAAPPKPVRRASWLNDTSQLPRPRKGSFASSSKSPTTSHPGTPSTDATGGLWGSHSTSAAMMARPAASFPWGTGIWNNSERKEPSRLSEVLPSPTSVLPPGATSNSMFGPEASISQVSPNSREQSGNSQFPFAIPLHPTPKAYRSQSYSVGQMDADAVPPSMSTATILGRVRAPHSAVQHRPSRPSMLSEMSSEGGLGKVKEVEDDEEEDAESPSGSGLQNSGHQSAESKAIEMLTRENAMLRQQQQQQQQYHGARIRPRSSTAAAYGIAGGYTLQGSVPEESEYAIDELDESNDGVDLGPTRRTLNRRMSEFSPGTFRSPFGVDSRKMESGKKNIWHSQLGFGGLGDIPQSRRHSFADVPTRQASISSLGGDHGGGLDMSMQEGQVGQDYASPYTDASNFSMTGAGRFFYPLSIRTGGSCEACRNWKLILGAGASPHFPGAGSGIGGQVALGQTGYSGSYPSPYGLHGPFSNRAPSPHRNVYGMSQPRHNQLLHIVYFKCSRADVFYIQEGTGLTVKPGDLVIVEADRGTDIGTVVRDNVDWQTAKELKEYYNEEHYKWLMMYSQNAVAAQEGTGLMGSPNGLQGSAVGGMGPPSHHHMQDSNSGELKPKLIKRLAQSHEIHALREKEGNEAKAKRVCMQKVKEHGLNMEILDAEFQMYGSSLLTRRQLYEIGFGSCTN